ncbi:unnamed protein product [Toxocara canis]|uniref:ZP domain-containing protein n=1 Tax=Toxocara canis TaxID=6265 RepID=A0A183UWT1_TOXCA|nr:unnamed protein product [Toxocara canis]
MGCIIFTGNIYVKGQFGIPACRQQYFGNDYPGATFTVRIGECGMRRIRQLQPHGLNYMIVFVTNFHPQFITKVDRAFNVRCFYAQSDKTVNSELEVSHFYKCIVQQRGICEDQSPRKTLQKRCQESSSGATVEPLPANASDHGQVGQPSQEALRPRFPASVMLLRGAHKG